MSFFLNETFNYSLNVVHIINFPLLLLSQIFFCPHYKKRGLYKSEERLKKKPGTGHLKLSKTINKTHSRSAHSLYDDERFDFSRPWFFEKP